MNGAATAIAVAAGGEARTAARPGRRQAGVAAAGRPSIPFNFTIYWINPRFPPMQLIILSIPPLGASRRHIPHSTDAPAPHITWDTDLEPGEGCVAGSCPCCLPATSEQSPVLRTHIKNKNLVQGCHIEHASRSLLAAAAGAGAGGGGGQALCRAAPPLITRPGAPNSHRKRLRSGLSGSSKARRRPGGASSRGPRHAAARSACGGDQQTSV